MRKEYGQLLRKDFTDRMAAGLPSWSAATPPRGWYWPGERMFTESRDGVLRVVILQPDLKGHDAFDVQVGWSRLGRIPELSMRPCMDAPRSDLAIARAEYVCSLRDLARGEGAGAELGVGWVLDARSFSADFAEVIAAEEERRQPLDATAARARLEPLLDDAWHALLHVGLPYLEECAGTAVDIGSPSATP